MKKVITLIITIYSFFIGQKSIAQLLYNENFDTYTPSNLNNNFNGTTPGLGGWYTFYDGPNSSIINFKVKPETGRGNVLELPSVSAIGLDFSAAFRNDLNTMWQNRTPGNNILKITFDFFTGDSGNYIGGNESDHTRIDITNANDQQIIGFVFISNNNNQTLSLSYPTNRSASGTISSNLPYNYNIMSYNFFQNNKLKLTPNQWINLELYVDYNQNKLYFGIPSLNYLIVRNSNMLLGLGGSETYDDSPSKLIFQHYGYHFTKDYFPKFDNINISATNVIPTVNLKNLIPSKFNLHPNPSSDTVHISTDENIEIEEIKIVDLNGRTIEVLKYKNQNKVQLDIKELSVGTYMLLIKSKDGLAVKRIIKK